LDGYLKSIQSVRMSANAIPSNTPPYCRFSFKLFATRSFPDGPYSSYLHARILKSSKSSSSLLPMLFMSPWVPPQSFFKRLSRGICKFPPFACAILCHRFHSGLSRSSIVFLDLLHVSAFIQSFSSRSQPTIEAAYHFRWQRLAQGVLPQQFFLNGPELVPPSLLT